MRVNAVCERVILRLSFAQKRRERARESHHCHQHEQQQKGKLGKKIHVRYLPRKSPESPCLLR